MSQSLLYTKFGRKCSRPLSAQTDAPAGNSGTPPVHAKKSPGIQPTDYITKVLSMKGLKPAFPLIQKKNHSCDYAVGEKFPHVIAGHGGPALRQWRTTLGFLTFARRANVVKHDAVRAIKIDQTGAYPHGADKWRPQAGMVRGECADPRSRSDRMGARPGAGIRSYLLCARGSHGRRHGSADPMTSAYFEKHPLLRP